MKKNHIYPAALALLGGVAAISCESLDQGNLSELAESNLPQIEADSKVLVNAVYAAYIEFSST